MQGIEYPKDLKKCPVCGKRAYIAKDMPDGNYMGWSVGCASYKDNDGIHKKRMVRFNLNSKEECLLWWNTVCEGRDLT